MSLSQAQPDVDWVAKDGRVIGLNGAHCKFVLAPQIEVTLEVSKSDESPVELHLTLTAVEPSENSPNASLLQFVVVPLNVTYFAVVIGEGSPSGIRPRRFSPKVVATRGGEDDVVLWNAPFRARDPKDNGYFRIAGPSRTCLNVSIGPWWAWGVTSDASVINVSTGWMPKADGRPMLLPSISRSEARYFYVSTKLVDFWP
jgi:hypothetical protein